MERYVIKLKGGSFVVTSGELRFMLCRTLGGGIYLGMNKE